MKDGSKSIRRCQVRDRVKARVREECRQKDKKVNRSITHDKRPFINDLAEEAERAANSGQMKEVYDITEIMCNEPSRNMDIVKWKMGKKYSAKSMTSVDDREIVLRIY